MSWEHDPLWAKSRLYFEHAFRESREDPRFGLWCSLALELLGRAALASVSPTLLAEPDREHKYLLHALNRGSGDRRSIKAVQVFALCRKLFPVFSDEDLKAAIALINRRNDELHSGSAAFDEYPSKYMADGVVSSLLLTSHGDGRQFGPPFRQRGGRRCNPNSR